jgi:hypothetical protein
MIIVKGEDPWFDLMLPPASFPKLIITVHYFYRAACLLNILLS